MKTLVELYLEVKHQVELFLKKLKWPVWYLYGALLMLLITGWNVWEGFGPLYLLVGFVVLLIKKVRS